MYSGQKSLNLWIKCECAQIVYCISKNTTYLVPVTLQTVLLGRCQQHARMPISLKLLSLTKDCYFQLPVSTRVCNINLLLTKRECRGSIFPQDGKIPTMKEPIKIFRFTSRLSYHNILNMLFKFAQQRSCTVDT